MLLEAHSQMSCTSSKAVIKPSSPSSSNHRAALPVWRVPPEKALLIYSVVCLLPANALWAQ